MNPTASKIFMVGFDEAGRGPLAGPVCAAAVILPENFPIELLNDSKKLSEKKRIAAEFVIKEKACFGIAMVDEKTIDEINILQAALLAMKKAFEELKKNLPEWCKKNGIEYSSIQLEGMTDGNFCPEVDISCKAEPKADGNYPPVMAASILAKNTRDRYMIEMDKLYPEYGYKGHKGYGTAKHREAIEKYGPSPIQRKSFKLKK